MATPPPQPFQLTLPTAMVTPPPEPFQLNLSTIQSESGRIIKAQKRHFLSLSFLFLLPISVSFSAIPFLNQLFSQPSTIPTAFDNNDYYDFDHNPTFQIFFPAKTIIFFLLNVLIFSFLATGSITYSVFHGGSGQLIELKSALKSAFTSFFPSYLQVNWIFVPVVVVVESSWGFEALKRTSTGIVIAAVFYDYGGNWMFLFSCAIHSIIFMQILLSYLAEITVFYMNSKVMHGENNAGEIVEQFGTEYVKVSLDDHGKLTHDDHNHVLEFI
ncbi:hypothetical protein COLO4_27959 [Corchorus olitorius]|uniref:Uncharacterized protein n=1 Tax=Corchorus olitorius TaxID=93759 RepID=A0A1R3HP47_9ROSI|nr:hypothetical protein COLO4_27959 [Corchorus olitorius]